MLTLLSFKMISLQYFGNISDQISPNNNKLDIFEIYMKRGVEKCLRWTFLTVRKPRKSIDKSRNSFWRTTCIVAYFQNQRSKTKKITKPVEIVWIDISKCYSFNKTMAYFLALLVDSSSSY